jgi:hypothetical protein
MKRLLRYLSSEYINVTGEEATPTDTNQPVCPSPCHFDRELCSSKHLLDYNLPVIFNKSPPAQVIFTPGNRVLADEADILYIHDVRARSLKLKGGRPRSRHSHSRISDT